MLPKKEIPTLWCAVWRNPRGVLEILQGIKKFTAPQLLSAISFRKGALNCKTAFSVITTVDKHTSQTPMVMALCH